MWKLKYSGKLSYALLQRHRGQWVWHFWSSYVRFYCVENGAEPTRPLRALFLSRLVRLLVICLIQAPFVSICAPKGMKSWVSFMTTLLHPLLACSTTSRTGLRVLVSSQADWNNSYQCTAWLPWIGPPIDGGVFGEEESHLPWLWTGHRDNMDCQAKPLSAQRLCIFFCVLLFSATFCVFFLRLFLEIWISRVLLTSIGSIDFWGYSIINQEAKRFFMSSTSIVLEHKLLLQPIFSVTGIVVWQKANEDRNPDTKLFVFWHFLDQLQADWNFLFELK